MGNERARGRRAFWLGLTCEWVGSMGLGWEDDVDGSLGSTSYELLERLSLSSIGTGEVRFTQWLAHHLDELTDRLGLDLELVGVEVPVGTFRVDLVAKVIATGDVVVVEVQFGGLNHDHLGKLLTYAAGMDAAYAVLVAEDFRDEFRSALEWMNRSTHDGVGFFGLRAEAIRIGDSRPAVQLLVEVQPDQWSKAQARPGGEGDSEREATWREFWEPVLEALHERYPGWTSSRTPSKESWMTMPAGRSYTYYTLAFVGTPHRPRVELYVDAATEDEQRRLWQHMVEHRTTIDAAAAPYELSWEELPGKRASRIGLYAPFECTLEERERWPEARTWLVDHLGPLRDAVQGVVNDLPR